MRENECLFDLLSSDFWKSAIDTDTFLYFQALFTDADTGVKSHRLELNGHGRIND